ncbi:serine hydrolase domain-containing protein [Polymorphum gilvum]|uniref:Beta-lactamase family protein n=1 Tax=Polymorphum gilvum (strain LMG 25793 / CGMCC 1.9160 / SL003B-26A1) TaxID=991905 RepID=F2J3Y6_POLGS|nr:serine hydrolase domain-containing protein [Polymorphum gilvum]ADZ68968.1 Beta-lactamase family protein [Polymorphum gilvum SL003B-26A1]
MTGAGATFATSRPLEDWLSAEREAGRLAGAVLEVRQAGKPVCLRAFGAKDSTGSDAKWETVYWIASMTKPIVSVAAMALVERGVLALGDEVQSFIPGFGRRGVLCRDGAIMEALRPPVILDLLTHVSGVTYGQFGDADIHARYLEQGVYDFFSDNERMADRLAELPLLHQPGTVFEYGMSTDLLGRVIEVVTGTTLDCALQELVLAPLGMHRTRFIPVLGTIAELPPSPTQRALAPPFSADQTWFSGGGGLTSTVSDYMCFAEMLRLGGALGGTRILRRETVGLMLQNHLPAGIGYGAYTGALGITAPWSGTGLGFGLGLAVRTRRSADLPGGLGEFLWPGVSGANFWVDPENALTAVFLTHAPEHRAQHRIGFRKAVYAGLDQDGRHAL